MIFTIAKVEVRLFFTKRKMIFRDFFGKWGGDWNKNMEEERGMGVGKKKCIMFFNDFSNQNNRDKKFFDNGIFINFASNPKNAQHYGKD